MDQRISEDSLDATPLMGINIFSGKATLSHCLPTEKGSTLIETNLLPLRSNIFLVE